MLPTLLLKLLLVAASALLSSLAARRFGHAVGGTLAGLPMIAGPIMGFVLLQTGADEVRDDRAGHAGVPAGHGGAPGRLRLERDALALADRAAAGQPGLLRPGRAAAAAARCRRRWPACSRWPCWRSAARLMPRLPIVPGAVAIPQLELACRVAAAMAVAWLIIRSAGVAPAAVSGLLLAVPITGNVLPCFTLPRYGAAATVALLRGFVRGLSGFGAFFVALYAGARRVGHWPVLWLGLGRGAAHRGQPLRLAAPAPPGSGTCQRWPLM